MLSLFSLLAAVSVAIHLLLFRPLSAAAVTELFSSYTPRIYSPEDSETYVSMYSLLFKAGPTNPMLLLKLAWLFSLHLSRWMGLTLRYAKLAL